MPISVANVFPHGPCYFISLVLLYEFTLVFIYFHFMFLIHPEVAEAISMFYEKRGGLGIFFASYGTLTKLK